MRFAKFVLDNQPEWYPDGEEYLTPDDDYNDSDARWVLITPFEKFYQENVGEVYTNMDHEAEALFDDLFYTGPAGMSVSDAIEAKENIFYMSYDQLATVVNL